MMLAFLTRLIKGQALLEERAEEMEDEGEKEGEGERREGVEGEEKSQELLTVDKGTYVKKNISGGARQAAKDPWTALFRAY